MVPAESKIICNSLDSTLRTALASFYVSDTDWYSIGGILSVMAIFQQLSEFSTALIRASRKFMHLDNGDVWAHCRGHVVGEPVPSPSVLPFRRLWLSKPYGGLASTSSARNAS